MRKLAAFFVALAWLTTGNWVGTMPVTLYAAPQADVKFETQSKPVSINKASLEELQTLRGIGPSIAGRIMKYREEHGRFEKLEDLTNVNGIGPGKFEKIKANVTL